MNAVSGTTDKELITQSRALVQDLFKPRAAIYWLDLLVSVSIAYASFYLTHQASLPWPARASASVICGLAFYRAALFIHELVHLNRHELRGFRIVWNALVGIPLLIPTFLYYTHLDHHRPHHYATHDDGEYLPMGRGPVWLAIGFVASSLWSPILLALRFMILTPMSWISGTLRGLIHKYASAMVIDPRYARPSPNDRERRIWRMQEAICLVYLWSVAACVYFGQLDWTWVLQVYVLAACVLFINAIRTLAAHRYRHAPEGPHTLVEQLTDSINHPNAPLLTEIWAPVGLRFHALHHLFPGLPYHALPEAHRRLMAGLPESSPYREVNSPSLTASLRQLWHGATAGRETTEARRHGEGVASNVGSLGADAKPSVSQES